MSTEVRAQKSELRSQTATDHGPRTTDGPAGGRRYTPRIVLVPGLYAEPSPLGWQNVWADWFNRRGAGVVQASAQFYRSTWCRLWTQGKAIAECAKLISAANDEPTEYPVVGIAHSNGTRVILDCLTQHPELHVDDLWLIAGAAYQDCRKNGINLLLKSGRVGRVFVLASPADRVVRAGQAWTGWLQPFGWGYGELGRVGPTHVDPAVAGELQTIWGYGDHGWFVYAGGDVMRERVWAESIAAYVGAAA